MFTDGSAIAYSAELTLTDAQKAAAVAVVYKVDGTTAYGVGLKESTDKAWCTSSAGGYSTNIEAIKIARQEGGDVPAAPCYQYTYRGTTYYLTGGFDGSDNWQAICGEVDDEETTGNYPAFEWANGYAGENGLTGSLASGWYIPSAKELHELYSAKGTVNNSLAKCGTQLSSNREYWSSSQYADDTNSYDNACYVNYANGAVSYNDKNYYGYYVRVVRAF